MGKFKEKELIEILNKYGTLSDNGEESIIDKILTTTNKKHEIKVSEIYNTPFIKIKFNITCPEGREKYGGSFVVDEGTTWDEFFTQNFANDIYGWIKRNDGIIYLYEMDNGYQVNGYGLKNSRK